MPNKKPHAEGASQMPKKTKEPTAVPTNPTTPRTPDQSRLALKKKVRMLYDLQRVRIQVAGRTYKRAEGVAIDLNEIDIAILELRANNLKKSETEALGDVKDHLKTISFYNKVLSDKVKYKGVGPTMAGVILSEFDIVKATTASKFWAFAGLKSIPCKRCAECHSPLTEGGIVYTFGHPKGSKCKQATSATPPVYDSGKAQKPTKGEKLPYNAWLRTKLVGVLGPVLLKVGSPWRKFYDDYKQRLISKQWGMSDGHRHNAAIRYMIKMLLAEIWGEWRAHEGLPGRVPYAEEYLGHKHQDSAQAVTRPATKPVLVPKTDDDVLNEAAIEAEIAAMED
jgi:hypothetical protein